MNIFQKWRDFLRLRRAQKAIGHYNNALQHLSDAAQNIGAILRESGNATAEVEEAIRNIEELANTALLTPNDLKRRDGA